MRPAQGQSDLSQQTPLAAHLRPAVSLRLPHALATCLACMEAVPLDPHRPTGDDREGGLGGPRRASLTSHSKHHLQPTAVPGPVSTPASCTQLEVGTASGSPWL